MAAKLPYLTSPGTLSTALDRIKAAATPPTVNTDFVQTKLQIKGGTGRAIPPFLKKIGFVGGDGKPTTTYERFRNSNKAVSGAAAAEALRHGYKPLYDVNEYAHELGDKDLKGLIVQITGLEESSNVVDLSYRTFKKLRDYADFEADVEGGIDVDGAETGARPAEEGRRRLKRELNIGYTINLNLPPSTNVEVFNAIFKSLKENLLDA
jgi:hypothetical protein